MNYKRILITGGYGSIGSVLLPLLKSLYKESDIGITTNKKKGIKIYKNFSRPLFSSDYLKKIYEFAPSEVLLMGSDYHPRSSVDNTGKVILELQFPTFNLINELIKNNILKKVIFVSSYNALKKIKSENLLSLDKPINPYGYEKLTSELILRNLCFENDISFYSIRPTNVVNPQSNRKDLGVISKFASLVIKNQIPEFIDDFKKYKDYIHVKDVAEAILKILSSDLKIKYANLTIASGYSSNSITIYENLKRINIGKEIIPPIKNDINLKDTYSFIKWKPKITHNEILNECLDSKKSSIDNEI